MGYEKIEQETVLVFDTTEDCWRVYSCYSPHITKLANTYGIDKFESKYEDGRESPIELRGKLKPNQVSFRKGNKRTMTEEQKLKLQENIKKAHEARKSNS